MLMRLLVLLKALAVVSVAGDPVPVPEEAPEPPVGSASRIVSGWESGEEQFPYQLFIMTQRSKNVYGVCGGSIIHAKWGLTAAHCIPTPMLSMIVRAGPRKDQPIYQTSGDAYPHPSYVLGSDDDIAVIGFHTSIPFSNAIQPVRIQRSQDKNRNYNDARLTASGWGGLWTGGPMPEVLNWVYLRGTTNAICHSVYGNIIKDFHLCAYGYNVTSQSICHGDSGGPLVITEDDGEVTQIGVMAFVSAAGCEVNHPRGFIRPGHYHDWIKQITGISFDW